MNCCTPTIDLTTQESQKITEKLKLTLFLYLIYSVVKMFFVPTDLFNELFLIIFVILTVIQYYFVLAAMSIFFILIQLVFSSFPVLLVIQNYFLGLATAPLKIFIIQSINLCFYVLLTYYCFKAYKEYKALFYEQRGNNNYVKLEDKESQKTESKKGYVPFSGKGTTWG